MFNTVSIKEQYRQVFCCGNKESPEVVLILGSCRVVPFVNYLNAVAGNRFQIRCIDPINFNWDEHGNEQDSQTALKALETDAHFLSILESVTIFIHEGLSNYGILNTLPDAETNIYQHGMSPHIDINVPNYHDVFILFNDFIAIDPQWQKELTKEEEYNIVWTGEEHIKRFCGICAKSSFPEFGPWFRENYLKQRLFHSFNHVSSNFTVKIFQLINEKFLKIDLPPGFWNLPEITHDMYANNSTKLCKYDVKWRPYSWPEPVSEVF